MGKMRNADTPVGQLAQWMGRKCVNHHPLEELGIVGADKRPTTYKAKSKGNVSVHKDREGIVIYRQNGRNFMLEVKEISDDQIEADKLVAVGH